LRVLIAEDEDGIRQVYDIILKDAGHEVADAKDGEECLKIYFEENAAGRPFDVVITDLRMPRMDGIEVVKKILEKYPDQKIFIATAFSKDVPEEHGELLNRVKVLRKPFDLDDLVAAVNSAKSRL
jgi:CheY-like chemotaxis protein